MSSERSAESKPKLSLEELATFVSTLQSEMLQRDTKIDSMQETIVNLSHENELLKRRLFGNKTERLHTSENQLALGSLLDDEKQLQKQLNAALAQTKASADVGAPPASPATAPPSPKFAPRPSARMFLELKVLHPEGTNKSVVAAPGQTVQIGRLKHENQLFLGDPVLAPVHFSVTCHGEHGTVTDLNQGVKKHKACEAECFVAALRNAKCTGGCRINDRSGEAGVYLNGEKVKAAVLKDGDSVVAGSSAFKVALTETPPLLPPAAPPTAPALTLDQQARALDYQNCHCSPCSTPRAPPKCSRPCSLPAPSPPSTARRCRTSKIVGPPTRPGGQPQLAPNRNPGNVEAAAELARQSGTKQTIVANEKAFP